MRRVASIQLAIMALVCAFAVSPTQAVVRTPAIVGGTQAGVDLARISARIVTDEGLLCTGTIIDPSWILTAGHCISPRAEIFYGSTDEDSLTDGGSATGYTHPYYLVSGEVPRFDFGLYQLDSPLGIDGSFLPALVDYDETWAWVPGSTATTIGWGLTSADGSLSDNLLMAELTILSDDECEALDASLGAVFDPTTAVCANDSRASACNGDSGGPLLVRNASGEWEVVGVTSYGPETCNGHSVYGWVPAGLAWIRSVTGLPFGSGSESAGTRTVSRIFGLDRYETASAVGAFWDQTDAVFVATGSKFPDALAAGSTASAMGAPVLLVNGNSVPSSTRYQIRRLAPPTIYVAGGPLAVDDGVLAELGAIAGSEVIRVGGADRYETADLLGDLIDGAKTQKRVWVASGRDFADPLVASTAAAVFGESFVLIDGVNPLPERTRQRLVDLAPTKIVILGPDGSFSTDTRNALASVAPVQALTGGDASWRSAAVWGDFTESEWVSLATVENFPDALSAVPFSALDPVSPLMLVTRDCVPGSVLDQVNRLGTERIALFGGPLALSESVENLRRC